MAEADKWEYKQIIVMERLADTPPFVCLMMLVYYPIKIAKAH